MKALVKARFCRSPDYGLLKWMKRSKFAQDCIGLLHNRKSSTKRVFVNKTEQKAQSKFPVVLQREIEIETHEERRGDYPFN